MAKPLLSAEAIYDEALRVLATDGAAGMTVRNLSNRLRCSPKTLYQQVGNRDALVRGVVARAFASIEIDFSTDMGWQDSVRTWCLALRSALTARREREYQAAVNVLIAAGIKQTREQAALAQERCRQRDAKREAERLRREGESRTG